MNARDLIEMLQELDPYTEIRIAHQPNYPFELSIENMATVGEGEDQIAYLGEGSPDGYLSQEEAVARGWTDAEKDDEEELTAHEENDNILF